MDHLRILALFSLLAVYSGCGPEQARPAAFVSSQLVMDLPEEGQVAVQTVLEEYCGTPTHPKYLRDESAATEAAMELGRKVYESRCVACHGYSGDGAGPAAEFLWPRPRDYRQGTFKFTSTLPGAAPVREDIKRVIMEGAPGTAMPSFRLLPEAEIESLVTYVLALTHRGELELQLALDYDSDDELLFTEERVQGIVDYWDDAESKVFEPEWDARKPYTLENIVKGREFFMDEKMGCFKCHGADGKGSKAGEVGKDDWGFEDAAADLTTGQFHGGGRPEDIYRRIYAGIKGSPMPNFSGEDALGNQPETIWNLAHYVRYLADQARREVAAEQLERQRLQATGLLTEEEDGADEDVPADDGQ